MSDADSILDKLPPERLLDADHLQPIVAGINCMHSIETIQQYLAYENKHQNRTPVQSRLRERAREIRRDESDGREASRRIISVPRRGEGRPTEGVPPTDYE